MPPNAEKRAELSVRREVIKHLIEIGLSIAEMSRLFGVGERSIFNDCVHVGVRASESFWSNERNNTVYRSAFLAYTRIVFGQYHEEDNQEVLDVLGYSLTAYLGIQDVRLACVGIADMMNCFNRPLDDEMLGRYRNFLNSVFSVEYVESLEGKTLFMYYLQHVLDNPTQVPSRDSVSKDIAQWIFSSEMNNPRMSFGSEIISFVEKALKSLSERQRMVIKANFGLGQRIQNLSEWAIEQNVSRAYASFLHTKGVKRFRRYFSELGVFTSSTRHSVHTHWSLVANGVLNTYSMIPTTKVDRVQFLFKSVETLPLPTRAHNCFREANINTIGDLVQRTAKELMRLDNFGDRCLKETKEKLAGIGLSLGMKIPSSF
jgi:hypothetical protein